MQDVLGLLITSLLQIYQGILGKKGEKEKKNSKVS